MSQDEAVVKAQALEVSIIQADALKDLEIAIPALDAAVQALDSLDKKDISEVRSFAKPPQIVVVSPGVWVCPEGLSQKLCVDSLACEFLSFRNVLIESVVDETYSGGPLFESCSDVVLVVLKLF